jgi:hypothetical protein
MKKQVGGKNWILYASIVVGSLCLLVIGGIVIVKMQTCPKDHVCMHEKAFKQVIKNKPTDNPRVVESTRRIQQSSTNQYIQDAKTRDRMVLDDPLYPPLNRTDRGTFESVVRETNKRNINIPMKDIGDSYRLVGYVVNKDESKDAGGNSWKLMARQKDRHEADFYMIPTNKDLDVKVPLTTDVIVGQRLRDVYTIPKEVQFNSPMLNKTSYEFVEIPKSSFSDSYN